MARARSLDLGCGTSKAAGAIGVDRLLVPGVDVQFDYQSGMHLPFRDNSFETVFMMDFIEHQSDIAALLREVHRVARPDAVVHIQYPHFSHQCAYNDSTHVQKFGMRALDHYATNRDFGRKYQYYRNHPRNEPDFAFEMLTQDVDFKGNFACGIPKKISQYLYNRLGMDGYEEQFCFILPLGNVRIDLRVLK